ncbi:MAG: hypothetical protein ACLSAX_10600 [Anaerotignum sp.]
MMNVRAALLDLTQTDQKAELAAYTLLPFCGNCVRRPIFGAV